MTLDKPDFLPAHVNWQATEDNDSLVEQLCIKILCDLKESMLLKSRVSLALSGGRTPVGLFQRLSHKSFTWSNVDITLVDERWVSREHRDSNELLVRRHFIQNLAIKAKFIGMKNNATTARIGQLTCNEALEEIVFPLDVVILGMGEDGHTASFFPCCNELVMAMDPQFSVNCLATMPTTAPYERMTLSYATLIRAKHRILYLVGVDKLATLEKAMFVSDPFKMPIYAFLRYPLSIFWSP